MADYAAGVPGSALLSGESGGERSGRVLLLALDALLVIGAVLAAANSRLGALALLVAFVGILATHLVVGVWGYRRVMSRPWPAVAPLTDDDDW